MKKILFTLFCLGIIVVGCSNDEDTTPQNCELHIPVLCYEVTDNEFLLATVYDQTTSFASRLESVHLLDADENFIANRSAYLEGDSIYTDPCFVITRIDSCNYNIKFPDRPENSTCVRIGLSFDVPASPPNYFYAITFEYNDGRWSTLDAAPKDIWNEYNVNHKI
ncbi:MAG: hypothetical protein IJV33_02825 [Bacteroidaceae bacterium]|nr:hypothetical protein [Bacteroidaceae bacterium]